MTRKIALLLARLNELHIERQIAQAQNNIVDLAQITKEQNSIYANFNALLIDTL